MNRELAMQVANAVLYEGYMLYPYRPSAIKNRQRWSFGILYPPAYREVAAGTERSEMHSECLLKLSLPDGNNERKNGAPLRDDGSPTLQIQLRFLHSLARDVAQKTGNGFERVPSLVVDGRLIESWDEGIERSFEISVALVALNKASSKNFGFPGSNQTEPLRDSAGAAIGKIRRTQNEISGTVSVSAEKLRADLFKLKIDITNSSSLPGDPADRDAALQSSLLSAHTILTVTGGEFVSLLDPPGDLRDAVSECKNIGNFPVLVGAEDERDMMLCSPIVLYDYPRIAPESAGDFFDGTEMDEMLTLRVMTLTDDEKSAMLTADDRVRNLLQRTEASAREQLARTHGTIRGMRPAGED
jgi:hypothetical protein